MLFEYLVMAVLVERLQASRSSQKQTPPLQPFNARLRFLEDLFSPHLEVSVLQEVDIPARCFPLGNTILLDPAIVWYLSTHPVIRSISVSELIAPLVHSKYNFFIIGFFAKIFPTGRSPCRSEPCYNPSAWKCSPGNLDCHSYVQTFVPPYLQQVHHCQSVRVHVDIKDANITSSNTAN